MRVFVLIVVSLLCWPPPARAQDQPPAGQQPPPPAPPAAPEPKIVKVTAEGYNKEDALKQALRKALEQGAGQQISAHSNVENYALVRETIYSRAAGIVSDYRMLNQQEVAGGAWEVTVEATVRPSAVATAWGDLQNVLDQIGRPKVMVWIDERIDGQLQHESIVENRIEQMFLKAGFDLVDRKAVEDLKRREAADAETAKDAAKLARLAKDAGAQVLVRGSAAADRAGLRNIYGTKAAFYNCSVQAKVYYTDTGKLLASESVPVTDRGVRSQHEFSPQAAHAALVDATFPQTETRREPALAIKLFEAVMEQWSIQLTAAGDIDLEVAGLEFRTFVDIKKALAGLERIKSVDGDYTRNTGSYRIKALITAQTLAELLTEKPFKDWLEVSDLKPNRIQAKAVEKR